MKNLIYIVAINFEVKKHVQKAWEFYCNKINCDFKIIDSQTHNEMAPQWERYSVIEQYTEYDNYIYVDADALVNWDCPDLFELLNENKLYVVKDIGSLEWTYNSIVGYKQFFPTVDVNWWEYFTTGFIKFDKLHRQLFADFIDFHNSNRDMLNKLQYHTLRKGFDQTPFNYFIRHHNQRFEILPEVYSLGHLHKKDIYQNGMFLTLPAYIWQFNGLPKEQLPQILEYVWNHIKDKYGH